MSLPRQPAPFRLTYSTMFDPPEELHLQFESALERVRPLLGRDYPLLVGGRTLRIDCGSERRDSHEVRSPINREWLLARFAAATPADVDAAVQAAQAAWPVWAATPWQERIRLLRRAAALIEERVYDISAVVALEVGKNRMESIGEVQETADLITWYCDRMQENEGFDRRLPDDPLQGFVSRKGAATSPPGAG